jgi:hypothetical protein
MRIAVPTRCVQLLRTATPGGWSSQQPPRNSVISRSAIIVFPQNPLGMQYEFVINEDNEKITEFICA